MSTTRAPPRRPDTVQGVLIRDDWSFAASSDPVSSFDYATVDWRQLSEQPESALSRSVLAGIACNQRQVGLAAHCWQQSPSQVTHGAADYLYIFESASLQYK